MEEEREKEGGQSIYLDVCSVDEWMRWIWALDLVFRRWLCCAPRAAVLFMLDSGCGCHVCLNIVEFASCVNQMCLSDSIAVRPI